MRGKRCGKCGKNPSLDYHSYCRECKRAEARATNERRRDKIRQWERDHMTPCVDCGDPVHGWRGTQGGRKPSERCPQCERDHKTAVARERTEHFLALRKQGMGNRAIAAQEGVTVCVVKNVLCRERVERFEGLEWVRDPYMTNRREMVAS